MKATGQGQPKKLEIFCNANGGPPDAAHCPLFYKVAQRFSGQESFSLRCRIVARAAARRHTAGKNFERKTA
jgi:hypothetical protein